MIKLKDRLWYIKQSIYLRIDKYAKRWMSSRHGLYRQLSELIEKDPPSLADSISRCFSFQRLVVKLEWVTDHERQKRVTEALSGNNALYDAFKNADCPKRISGGHTIRKPIK